jgi:hypothetical protein
MKLTVMDRRRRAVIRHAWNVAADAGEDVVSCGCTIYRGSAGSFLQRDFSGVPGYNLPGAQRVLCREGNVNRIACDLTIGNRNFLRVKVCSGFMLQHLCPRCNI